MKLLLKDIKKIYSPKDNLDQYNHIIIKDNKIDQLLEKVDEKDSYDKIINCKNKVILPGLINTHTHSSLSLLRGFADDYTLDKWLNEKIWPAEAKLTKEDIYWGAKLSILEMVKTGTTTFTDMYFEMENVAKAVQEMGVRAVLSEGLIEANDGKQGLDNALDFSVKWNGQANGRIKTCLGPHSVYTCSPDYLKEIKNLALEHDFLINIHISETKDEVEKIKSKYKMSTVQLLEKIGLFEAKIVAAHCVYLDAKEIKILKEKDVGIVYNPKSNTKLSSGIAPINKFLKKGLNVSFGTDGAASNNNLDLIEEARIGSYLQKVVTLDPTVLPIKTILEMLTANGAKTLNIKKLGKVKEGYLADLILFDIGMKPHYNPSYNQLSNIFYAGSGRDVDTVIIDGKVILENRIFKDIDEEEIYYKINQLTKKYH
ncbi:MAG: amidohydrolase [Halanaerobiales bacterium]|nr:amidohydrolase [Halanaerobiales bacterium]